MWEQIKGLADDGTAVQKRVRFAGLDGYLMSKVEVAWRRGLPKDYYDLVYTLLYNREGGPSQAARRLRTGKFRDRIRVERNPWAELRARFHDSSGIGPASYADQASLVDPASDVSQLRQDAVSAVGEFLKGVE